LEKVGMPRLLLLVLNTAAFGFLIFSLIRIYQAGEAGTLRSIKLAGGIFLLLLPVTMLAGFIKPTLVYLVIYPLAIGVFVFLVRLRD
jgi:hypothetical protein